MRVRIQFPKDFSFTFQMPVRNTDINYGGHVGNDKFLAFAHEARLAFFQQWGYTEMNAGGCSLIMADSAIQYKGEGFYGDVFTIEMCVGTMSSISFELFYKISTQREGQPIDIAYIKTGMLCFDYQQRKIAEMTEELQEKLQA
ncbi:MAG TPA: thioesterase family protein [Chitinophagaceae bacterium]|nr:thioesterase family protein [Chitinophagaceae bacterium]